MCRTCGLEIVWSKSNCKPLHCPKSCYWDGNSESKGQGADTEAAQAAASVLFQSTVYNPAQENGYRQGSTEGRNNNNS